LPVPGLQFGHLNEMSNQMIAVLGAGGFFGARFVEMCLASPNLSPVPVLRSFRSLARLSKFNLPVRRADTGDPADLARALEGCEAVLNLTIGDWLRIVPDTQVIYEAARQAGVKLFIHLSSAVVFGAVTNPAIDDDSSAQGAEWMLYAQEKARAEEYLRQAISREGGPRIVVLRPCLIWGPRSSWSTRPAKQLALGQGWLTNNGAGICNLCYVDNLVRYLLQVIASPAMQSGFYNVADPETVTWRGYYSALAEGLGLPADRVRLTSSSPVKPSAGVLVEWFKSRRSGYKAAKWLVNNLSAEGRSLLKWHLPALAGGGIQPPLAASDPLPPSSPPKFTRETWSAHHTVRKLPSDKFCRDFGQPELTSFDDAMKATAAWLRLAGYADF